MGIHVEAMIIFFVKASIADGAVMTNHESINICSRLTLQITANLTSDVCGSQCQNGNALRR
jgi:hypothetical protein